MIAIIIEASQGNGRRLIVEFKLESFAKPAQHCAARATVTELRNMTRRRPCDREQQARSCDHRLAVRPHVAPSGRSDALRSRLQKTRALLYQSSVATQVRDRVTVPKAIESLLLRP
jgi:hypothetical protein